MFDAGFSLVLEQKIVLNSARPRRLRFGSSGALLGPVEYGDSLAAKNRLKFGFPLVYICMSNSAGVDGSIPADR
jgi:hypothetical protein